MRLDVGSGSRHLGQGRVADLPEPLQPLTLAGIVSFGGIGQGPIEEGRRALEFATADDAVEMARVRDQPLRCGDILRRLAQAHGDVGPCFVDVCGGGAVRTRVRKELKLRENTLDDIVCCEGVVLTIRLIDLQGVQIRAQLCTQELRIVPVDLSQVRLPGGCDLAQASLPLSQSPKVRGALPFGGIVELIVITGDTEKRCLNRQQSRGGISHLLGELGQLFMDRGA